jgi:hypothetical protein
LNISTEILLQLRKYAKGELSPGERSAVEELLSRHPELGAELESTRQLIQAAERLERQRLVQLIVEIEARADRKGWLQALRVAISGAWRRFAGYLTMPPRVPKLAWAVTAAALLVAIAGYWWYLQSSDVLYTFEKTAYISPPAPEALRRGAQGHVFANAFREFESGNFRQSLHLLENIPDADSLYLFARVLEAHNYYRLGEYDRAIGLLSGLEAASKDSAKYLIPNPDHVAWTRILALLSEFNQNKTANTKQNLQSALDQFIRTSENPSDTYYRKARELYSLLAE